MLSCLCNFETECWSRQRNYFCTQPRQQSDFENHRLDWSPIDCRFVYTAAFYRGFCFSEKLSSYYFLLDWAKGFASFNWSHSQTWYQRLWRHRASWIIWGVNCELDFEAVLDYFWTNVINVKLWFGLHWGVWSLSKIYFILDPCIMSLCVDVT